MKAALMSTGVRAEPTPMDDMAPSGSGAKTVATAPKDDRRPRPRTGTGGSSGGSRPQTPADVARYRRLLLEDDESDSESESDSDIAYDSDRGKLPQSSSGGYSRLDSTPATEVRGDSSSFSQPFELSPSGAQQALPAETDTAAHEKSRSGAFSFESSTNHKGGEGSESTGSEDGGGSEGEGEGPPPSEPPSPASSIPSHVAHHRHYLGLPVMPFVALSVCLFANACSVTVLFPFIYFMIQDFGIAEDDNHIGYYAGFVGSAFMAGRALSSLAWGRYADRNGRNPVIYMGLIATVVMSLIFGFSQSFVWAMLARFINGGLNALVATTKATASELVVNEHQPRAMSVVQATWGSGIVVGPAIGGLLANRTNLGSFCLRFPYALPMIVVAAFGFLGLVLIWLYLPETLSESIRDDHSAKKAAKARAKQRDEERMLMIEDPVGNGSGDGDSTQQFSTFVSKTPNHLRDLEAAAAESAAQRRSIPFPAALPFAQKAAAATPIAPRPLSLRRLDRNTLRAIDPDASPLPSRSPSPAVESDAMFSNGETSAGAKQSQPQQPVLTEILLDGDAVKERFEDGTNSEVSFASHDTTVRQKSLDDDAQLQDDRFGTTWKMLRYPPVAMMVASYGLWSFSSMVLNEVIPIWAVTTAADGGLSFTESDIGIALAVSGAILMAFTLFVYPIMARYLGSRRLMLYCVILVTPIYVITPDVTRLVSISTEGTWAAAILAMASMRVVGGFGFTSMFILINNSVPTQSRATVNGVAMMIASIFKALGPSVGGSLLSWSLTNGIGYPLDAHFIFYLLPLFTIVVACIAFRLPKSLDVPYDKLQSESTKAEQSESGR